MHLPTAFLICAFLVSAGAFAQDVRQVTDGLGREVAIPAHPQRVITTHDATHALPLYELGVPVIGSTGRAGLPGVGWDLMGLKKLFGVTAEQAGIANISGGISYDAEKIRTLKPDLIIGSEGNLQDFPLFEPIAPVFLGLSYSRDSYGLDATRRLARDLGLETKLAEMDTKFAARAALLKELLPPAEDRRAAVIMFYDQIRLLVGTGGLNEALDALGFAPPALAEAAKGQLYVPLSPEVLPQLDVDLLILLPLIENPDAVSMRADLDRVAPGWHLLFAQEKILFGDAERLMTVTFASAHASLEAIAAHYDVALPPRAP